MKAISLWQPWASAIALLLKRNETRGWWTNYRGPLAIHAAKKISPDLREFYRQSQCNPLRAAGYPFFEDLPFGGIVATCRLYDCRPTTDLSLLANLSPQERSWGNYEEERFAWLLTDIVALERPIPCKGEQGFFEVDLEKLKTDFAAQDGRGSQLELITRPDLAPRRTF